MCVGGCFCFQIGMRYAIRTISIVAAHLAAACSSLYLTIQVRFKTGLEREHQLVVMVI